MPKAGQVCPPGESEQEGAREPQREEFPTWGRCFGLEWVVGGGGSPEPTGFPQSMLIFGKCAKSRYVIIQP